MPQIINWLAKIGTAISLKYKFSTKAILVIIVIIIIIVLLILFGYRRLHKDDNARIMTVSNNQAGQAEVVAKVAQAADIVLSPQQSKELAEDIRQAEDKPDQVFTVKTGDIKSEIAKVTKDKNVDFSIVTQSQEPLVPNTSTELRVYNIKAYPRRMVEVGLSVHGSHELAYLQRVKVPRIPILLPKGYIGYLGPYIKTGKDGSDHGIKLLFPLE